MNRTIGSPHYLTVKNPETVSSIEIPVLFYSHFYMIVSELLEEKSNQCSKYIAYPDGDGLKFICYINDINTGEVKILSHELLDGDKKQLLSLSKDFHAMYSFEHEIAKGFGIDFLYLTSHPTQRL